MLACIYFKITLVTYRCPKSTRHIKVVFLNTQIYTYKTDNYVFISFNTLPSGFLILIFISCDFLKVLRLLILLCALLVFYKMCTYFICWEFSAFILYYFPACK